MPENLAELNPRPIRTVVLQETLSVSAGLGFTALLFFGVAHFTWKGEEERPVEIEELRTLAMPMEAPPPKIVPQPAHEETSVLPFAGLEIAASDSPVKIAVTPADLEALLPTVDVPPVAAIQPALFHSELKPKLDVSADFSRVFQASEVDKRPGVLSRPNPYIPRHVRDEAESLKVSLLIIVDGSGRVTSIRILNSSGNPGFDAIIVEDVQNSWVFSPAIKEGRRVRCLLQQAVTVSWSGSDPFEP
jgi:TonB family protein